MGVEEPVWVCKRVKDWAGEKMIQHIRHLVIEPDLNAVGEEWDVQSLPHCDRGFYVEAISNDSCSGQVIRLHRA